MEEEFRTTIVIFGASGDLTYRKLIPALHSLACASRLPEVVKVLGVSRTNYSDQEFRDHLREGTDKYGRLSPSHWEGFKERLFYLPGLYDDPETYHQLEQRLRELYPENPGPGNILFYLAVPPQIYTTIIQQIGSAGLNHCEGGWVRIVIEKPFGNDLQSAMDINQQVHSIFDESQVYRIDHFLGKETVQNLMAFRFANFIFNSVWGRNYVDHVQISALEQVGVGERAGYYDQAGVIRDMVQNHLLQLLALTAMEPPTVMDAKALRDEKVKVLQAVQPIRLQDCVWGQYRGYLEEDGVASQSSTPTYAAMRVFVNNWRWQGVPFYLRTGKGIKKKATEITLEFKKVPVLIFQDEPSEYANQLSICIQPDEGMHLRFQLKVPESDMRTSPVHMDFHYEDIFGKLALPDAYERLLMDALQGDASHFTRNDEIERAWEIVMPLINAWEEESKPRLSVYQPGSSGPVEAEELARQDGVHWALCCQHEEEQSK